MKRAYVLTLCAVFLIGLLITAGCREEAKKDGRGDGKSRVSELKKRIMERTMELDEATLNKVVEVTDRYDEQKMALVKERRDNMEALRAALKSGETTDSEVSSLIDKLNKGEQDLFSLREQEQKELSTLLTTQQLGRYLVFDEKFRREVRRHIESKKQSHRDRWKRDRSDAR